MKYSLVAIGLSLLITSCGKTIKTKGSNPVMRFNSLSMHPVVLNKQLSRCNRGVFLEGEKIFNVQRLLNGSVVNEKVDLEEYLRDSRLVDANKDILNKHIYGYKKETVFKVVYYDEDTYDILEQRDDVTHEGDANTICPGNMSYERNSYENVGIIVSNALNKTKSAISAVIDDEIASVELSLTPLEYTEIKVSDGAGRVYRDDKGYKTDNAYYSPSELKIVFLPQSQEVIDAGMFGKPFWEVPMVASHEYGHHIFSTLYPNFDPDYEASAKLHFECFDNRFSGEKSLNHISNSRTVTRNEIRGGLNEGVADLIAQYTLSERENYLGDLNCFKGNREVKSATFYDGTVKKFNSSNVSRMFSSIEYETSSCNITNVQQIHHIGAVFAHATDAIQSAYELTNTEKLENTLNWIKALNDDDGLNSLSGRRYFKEVIRHFKKIILDRYGREHINLINDYFSGV